MRNLRVIAFLFVVATTVGTRDASAGRERCDNTHCGMRCNVWGSISGYCNPPAEETTGCIQLYGPDCASLQGAYCCRNDGGVL